MPLSSSKLNHWLVLAIGAGVITAVIVGLFMLDRAMTVQETGDRQHMVQTDDGEAE